MAFVNPYNFIRFPDEVKRQAPPGHTPSRAEARELYTGHLDVTWALRTPLAMPHTGEWGWGKHEVETPMTGSIRIPGASAKGAVRSLHETLFGGCARIADLDFVPVYRDRMTPELLSGWQLAVVTRDRTQTQEALVRLCHATTAWTDARAILAAAQTCLKPRLPRTGDLVDPKDRKEGKGRPNTYRGVAKFLPMERGDRWRVFLDGATQQGMSTILVTDTSARTGEPCYWATARLVPGPDVPLSAEALARFDARREGADQERDAGPFQDVDSPYDSGRVVAQRRSRDGQFLAGDVIWVRPDAQGNVTDIKLSLGWRSPARGQHNTLGSRIPAHVHACGALSDGLCLSCQVFGSADTRQKEDTPEGRQDSYGGHVRFGDIVGHGSGRAHVTLAVLSSPHPGAGMYYLDSVSEADLRRQPRIKDDPPAQWGSATGEAAYRSAGHTGERPLRGRKYYWHSNPGHQKDAKGLTQPRYEKPDAVTVADTVFSHAHIVESAELTQRITFDGLDAVSLATLLASLSPGLVLGEGDFATHLGRGKPLGLGSVVATFNLKMTTTADRYTATAEQLTSLPDLSSALGSGVHQRCGDVTGVHNDARAILAINGLGDEVDDVSYPSVKPWRSYSTPDFHYSFKFFVNNSGLYKEKTEWINDQKVTTADPKPWAPLPETTAPEHAQEAR